MSDKRSEAEKVSQTDRQREALHEYKGASHSPLARRDIGLKWLKKTCGVWEGAHVWLKKDGGGKEGRREDVNL